jgi:hypothetical protein
MISSPHVIALVIAASFASGLNAFATVATLGLLGRSGYLDLPPGLELLTGWPVIAASVALFSAEFIADKIPAADLIWNALQTFVRVPIAALVAYGATTQLSPVDQLIAAGIGSVVALIAHGGKTAARVAVTPSPEPLSNIGLSLAEDAAAISITWLIAHHPIIATSIALILIVVIVLFVRLVLRAVRALWTFAASPTPSSLQ